jgi:hypothetical protein
MRVDNAKKSSPKTKTPAQAFEALLAPIFVPPSRPDLKEKYASGRVVPTARAAPKATQPRTAAIKKATPPEQEDARYRTGKWNPSWKTAQTNVFASPSESQIKPKRKVGDTPAQAFEKLAAPIFVPPSRPDLKAKYKATSTSRGKLPKKSQQKEQVDPRFESKPWNPAWKQ